MKRKQWILLAAGVLALALFFLLPPNRLWMRDTVLGYWNDFTRQRKNLNLEHRRIARYDSTYIYSQQIATLYRQKGAQGLVLVPASRYFTLFNMHYDVPEPVVFYYFTGVKNIRAADSGSMMARWYVSVNNGRLALDTINDPALLSGVITFLKKIDPSL